jgi:hypothetical protein
MSSNPPPDTFYLVLVDKPSAYDPIETKWQAWARFLKSLESDQYMNQRLERLTENAFLFHTRNNVLLLNWFLGQCGKESIAATVFFLPQKPELCK